MLLKGHDYKALAAQVEEAVRGLGPGASASVSSPSTLPPTV
jgi:hypothetical protein